ncbi:hypothetical protein E4U54_006989, partial [Claviceps lovelessii]
MAAALCIFKATIPKEWHGDPNIMMVTEIENCIGDEYWETFQATWFSAAGSPIT